MQVEEPVHVDHHDQVVVLDPGCEQAQNLGKALSHPVAADIISMLQAGPLSLSVLSEKLAIPMNNVKYHLGNLQKAGVIEVAGTKYSEKGRVVRLYQLRDQVFVVSPKKVDLRAYFTRYAALLGIILCAGGSAYLLLPLMAGNQGSGAALEGSLAGPVIFPPPLPVFTVLAVILIIFGAGWAAYWFSRNLRGGTGSPGKDLAK